MKDVFFENPVFHAGPNTTQIRFGIDYVVDEEIALCNKATGERVAIGRVLAVFVGPWATIPNSMLALSRNPKCDTHDGLREYMREHHSDWKLSETLTVIMFEVI